MSEAVEDFLDAPDDDAALKAAARLRQAGLGTPLADGVLEVLQEESPGARRDLPRRLRRLERVDFLLPPLLNALGDRRRAHRRNAARTALATLASPEAADPARVVDRLAELVRRADSPDDRLVAATTLGDSGNPRAVEPLIGALGDDDVNVVAAAAEALGVLGDTRAIPHLDGLIRDGGLWTRAAAVVALGRIGDPAAIPILERCARQDELREAVADAFADIGDPAALPILEQMADTEDEAAWRAVLSAAAAILARHSEIRPSEGIRSVAGRDVESLARELEEIGSEDAARILGLSGSAGSLDALLSALHIPHCRALAAAALELAVPEDLRHAIFDRLETSADADPGERSTLLEVLPPLSDGEAIRKVLVHLQDPDPRVRTAAANAVGRSDNQVVVPLLLDTSREPDSRLGAVQALASLDQAPCGSLLEFLDDRSERVRSTAAKGLGRCATSEARTAISAALDRESSPEVREQLAMALGRSGGHEAVRRLSAMLHDDDVSVRFMATRALPLTRAPEAFEPLLRALDDPVDEIRAAALRSLGELEDPRAARPVERELAVGQRDLRRVAASAYQRLAPSGAVDRLRDAIEDPDREIRLAAVRTLARLSNPAARPLLRKSAREDPDRLVRRTAAEVLEEFDSPPPAVAATGEDG